MKYTKEQIEELKQIRYVKNVTSKSIIFTYEAKVKSLKLREKWLTSKEIFQELWFPEYVLNSKIPSQSICRWSRNKQTWIIEKKRWKEKIFEKIPQRLWRRGRRRLGWRWWRGWIIEVAEARAA